MSKFPNWDGIRFQPNFPKCPSKNNIPKNHFFGALKKKPFVSPMGGRPLEYEWFFILVPRKKKKKKKEKKKNFFL
jgi:hypothetical protein